VQSAASVQAAEPEKLPARKDVHVTREQAIIELQQQAEMARASGNGAEAMHLYDRLLAIDPANVRAQTGKTLLERERRHDESVADARKLLAASKLDAASALVRKVLIEDPRHAAALALQQELQAARLSARDEVPRLKPPVDKPVTLELRDANIRMVFEALSRATGINFILDKDIKPDTKATVFVKKARVEDAIEMVLATNGLQKKILSETNALVYPNIPAKLKDYEDLVIRSFYLTNAKAKDVGTLLKTVLKTKDIYIDDRLNMLVLRDTPQVVRIADKLIASNDLPDPEVMLDIEVLEVSRNRLQALGIQYPNQLAVIGTNGATTLEALHNVTAANVSVSPLPALNFRKEGGDTNLLANPRIRVRNNEKAKVQVGDRVPIVTTTQTANGGSSESVAYVDVGLKLEVEPRVALDDHVNIKVGLEVSSLGTKTQTKSGSVVYQIGTRNAATVLRLKDGETQVLAGLINDAERKSGSRLPGIGDIPILGRLFSTQTDQRDKTEIVLAITPRIVGNISRPDAEVVEYWSGTGTAVSDSPMINVPGAGAAGNRATGRFSGAEGLQEPLPTQDPVQVQEAVQTPEPTLEQKESSQPTLPPTENIVQPVVPAP
jgi:general secretion pathway protein D